MLLLESLPYRCPAYTQMITKLMKASVRSVALDIVMDTSSSYGEVNNH
ncbi:hypothetical protein [Anabaena lutea]|uniref:Uncharacterized protein n=1 Tax=Anabaena lutea FACHB-196 TaxID=2692881 RepID=A0ABR8FH35_9NOST|nr:hypothetical protein [Anabaena lutea]MBD2569547.1 hypothetical protein [Anabaena lutea FACHB-196]